MKKLFYVNIGLYWRNFLKEFEFFWRNMKENGGKKYEGIWRKMKEFWALNEGIIFLGVATPVATLYYAVTLFHPTKVNVLVFASNQSSGRRIVFGGCGVVIVDPRCCDLCSTQIFTGSVQGKVYYRLQVIPIEYLAIGASIVFYEKAWAFCERFRDVCLY